MRNGELAARPLLRPEPGAGCQRPWWLAPLAMRVAAPLSGFAPPFFASAFALVLSFGSVAALSQPVLAEDPGRPSVIDADAFGDIDPPRSWSPEQGFGPGVTTPSATDYDAYQMAAKTFAIERLGYTEAEATRFAERRAQELRDKMALAADAERQTKLDALIEADAGENEQKRDEVATGRQDAGIGIKVRDKKQNGLKAGIAKDAAERSGAGGKIRKATAGTLDSVAPGEGEKPQNLCDASGAAAGTPQKPVKLTSAQKKAMAEKIIAEAKRQGVDPALALAVAYHEGGFNPNARGLDGEIGTFQLMAATAANLGVTDRSDPDQNIFGGVTYLRQQIARFGNTRQALAAYNGGPGIVRSDGSYSNTQYPELVLAHYQSFRDQIASGALSGGGDPSSLEGLVRQVSASGHTGCDQRLKHAMDENTKARAAYAGIANERVKAQNQRLAALIQRALRELQLQSAVSRGASTGDRTDWDTVEDADPTKVDCPPELAAKGNVTCFVLPEHVSQDRLLQWLTTLQDLAPANGATASVELKLVGGKSTAIVTSKPTAAPDPKEADGNSASDGPAAKEDIIAAEPASPPSETLPVALSSISAAELEAALAASRAAAQ